MSGGGNRLSSNACLAEGTGTLVDAFSLGETQAVKWLGCAQLGMCREGQSSLAWLADEHGGFLQ